MKRALICLFALSLASLAFAEFPEPRNLVTVAGQCDLDEAEVAALLRDPATRAVAESARGLSTVSVKALSQLIGSLHALEHAPRSAGIAREHAA